MKTVRIRNLSLDLYFLLMFYMKIKIFFLSTELELDKIKVARLIYLNLNEPFQDSRNRSSEYIRENLKGVQKIMKTLKMIFLH